MAEEEWPVELRGVTESLVTTRGPNNQYNVAALGIHAPAESTGDVRARTWGRTRTWRNFRERGEGYVQFTRDPVVFANAALTIREQARPILDNADAWVQAAVERTDAGDEGGTRWVDWRLTVEDSETRRTVVPTFNRGYAAVVEATVAASRLNVDAYDSDRLRERIAYFERVVDRCGGPRERQAFDLIREQLDDPTE